MDFVWSFFEFSVDNMLDAVDYWTVLIVIREVLFKEWWVMAINKLILLKVCLIPRSTIFTLSQQYIVSYRRKHVAADRQDVTSDMSCGQSRWQVIFDTGTEESAYEIVWGSSDWNSHFIPDWNSSSLWQLLPYCLSYVTNKTEIIAALAPLQTLFIIKLDASIVWILLPVLWTQPHAHIYSFIFQF